MWKSLVILLSIAVLGHATTEFGVRDIGRFEIVGVYTPEDDTKADAEILSVDPRINGKLYFELNQNFPTYDSTYQLGFELYGTFGVEVGRCSDGSILEGGIFDWSMDNDLPSEQRYNTHFETNYPGFETNYPAFSNGALAQVNFELDEESSFLPSVTDGNLVEFCLRIKMKKVVEGEDPIFISSLDTRFAIKRTYIGYFGLDLTNSSRERHAETDNKIVDEMGSSKTSTAPMLFFNLPSLSLTLDVEKEDDAIIPFQEQLKSTMEAHLEKFYETKILTSEVGIPTFLDVDLESQLMWEQLWVAPKEITEGVNNQTFTKHGLTKHSFVKRYQVEGIFNCKIKLQVEPINTEEAKSVRISETLMNVFFLEAFENENYMDLKHDFLTDPLLRDIISTEVEVMDIGFIHPYDENGDLLFDSDDDDFLGGSIFKNKNMSPIEIVGTVFLVILFLAGGTMWFYICYVMKIDLRDIWKKKRRGRSRNQDDQSNKESNETYSIDSGDSSEEEENDDYSIGRWAASISENLDAWASSITSIPLRDVAQKRRKKCGGKVVGRPYFRPGNEHSSSLECVTEADNESWCSSVKSRRSTKSNKSAKSSRSRKSSKNQKRGRSRTRHAGDDDESSLLMSAASFDSSTASSVAVIHEDDAENDVDEEEQSQSSPFLIKRQVISMIPSEDEIDDSWNKRQVISTTPSEDEIDAPWNNASGQIDEF